MLEYPEDRLVLLAVRENASGRYLGLDEMAALVDTPTVRGVELVRTFPGSASTLQALMAEARVGESSEGWVIRFDDGHTGLVFPGPDALVEAKARGGGARKAASGAKATGRGKGTASAGAESGTARKKSGGK